MSSYYTSRGQRGTEGKPKKKKPSKTSDKYRKFLGNKVEGQGFADKRKKKAKYEYLKLLQKEGKLGKQQKHLSTEQRKTERSSDKQHQYSKAQWQFERKREEKRKKKEVMLKKRSETEEALQTYRNQKKERHKKLCKRTYKGQPIMKNQIEFLLEKIQKQVNQT